jgi:hypothetical protein
MLVQTAIEPLGIELTGEEITEDVAWRLMTELAKSCYLTKLCAYRGYCAKITAELQLVDFDTVTVTAGARVGNFDPAQLLVTSPWLQIHSIAQESKMCSVALKGKVRTSEKLDNIASRASKLLINNAVCSSMVIYPHP